MAGAPEDGGVNLATTQEFADKVCRRIAPFGDVRSRKMFGEYLVYVNERPVLTLCDGRVFVKKLPQIADLMAGAECGYPYEGAKEAYLLDLGDDALVDALLPLPSHGAGRALGGHG